MSFVIYIEKQVSALRSNHKTGDCPLFRSRPSLAVNAASNWAALGINMLVAFFLTPYIISSLGLSSYGIWALVVSVVGYYGLLDLGVSSAILRYVARYAGQRNHVRLNEVMNTSIAIFFVLGAVVAMVTYFAAGPLAGFFNVAAGDRILFQRSIVLLGFTTGFMFPGNVLQVAIIAHERFTIRNAILVATTVVRAVLIVFVLARGGNIVDLSVVNLAVCVGGISLNLVVVKFCFPYVRFSWRFCKKAVAGSLFTFGFFSCVSQIGNLLRTKVGAAVIGRFATMELVGIYNVGLLLYMYALKLIISCGGVFQPRLASLAGIDGKQFTKAIMRYSVILSNFTVAVGITGALLCGDFLRLWLPENFGDPKAAMYVFYILLASLMPNMMTDVSVSALQAVKKHKYIAYQTVSEGVVNLALSIWLVGRFGIIGVAIAAAIPAVIARVVIQPIYCCKILGIKWSVYMRQIMVTPLLVFGALLLFANLSGVLPAAVTYPQLILKGALVFGAYMLIAFYVCIGSQMRQEIFARLSRVYLGVAGVVFRKGLVGSENSDG